MRKREDMAEDRSDKGTGKFTDTPTLQDARQIGLVKVDISWEKKT